MKWPKVPSHQQGRDEHHPPDQEAGQDGCVGRAWRALHHAGFGGLEGQRQGQGHGGDHVHPQDLHRGERQGQAQQDGGDDGERLAAVGGQQEEDGLAQVVVDGAAFLHGVGDGGEVVVGQHHLGGLLGRLGALDAHGHAHVGALEAGASLTPSPVMAVTWPLAWMARTRRSLCSGWRGRRRRPRAPFAHKTRRRDLVQLASGDHVAAGVDAQVPAMARAVTAWSPVIIFTTMPAAWHSATASMASSRGGSMMPHRATR
jgi:hypothetical protein